MVWILQFQGASSQGKFGGNTNGWVGGNSSVTAAHSPTVHWNKIRTCNYTAENGSECK